MRWTTLTALGLLELGGGLVTGCFYTEPINQRPSIDIVRASADAVHRGDFVTFTAVTSDPENQSIELAWSAWLCTDASAVDGCDATPFETGTLAKFAFEVPPVRLEQAGQLPVKSIRIGLTAQDEYGARARPDQQAIITVDNLPPTVELDPVSRYGYVEGIDLDVFAKVTDPDDGPANVGALVWEVFTPSVTDSYTTTIVTPPSTDQLSRTERLTVHAPIGIGQWMFRATATDRLGATAVQTTTISIAPDHDPCLRQWSPIAPLDGVNALPMSVPTLFQVPIVEDDLDLYPPVPSDPILGTTRFAWSIKRPGASSFTPLATTSNGVELDPQAYAANDLVELRVQIYDRRNVAITCDPALLTCSTISDPTCIQRLTWRVAVQ